MVRIPYLSRAGSLNLFSDGGQNLAAAGWLPRVPWVATGCTMRSFACARTEGYMVQARMLHLHAVINHVSHGASPELEVVLEKRRSVQKCGRLIIYLSTQVQVLNSQLSLNKSLSNGMHQMFFPHFPPSPGHQCTTV
jgi:hypothetical protein